MKKKLMIAGGIISGIAGAVGAAIFFKKKKGGKYIVIGSFENEDLEA